MGISLYGLTPATTYDALIKTGDNAPIDATLKPLSDGVGTNLPMEASTTGINFTGSLLQGGVAVPTAAQVAAKQDTLVSGTNIKTINGTSVLGSGNIVTPITSPSGVAGAIQFSNGSAFASDATNFFWDNTNKRLGVGTNAPSLPLEVNGAIYANGSKTNTIYGQGFITTPGTFWQIRQSTANDISFDAFNGGSAISSLFLKQSGGNVGINTVTPTAKLEIKGSGSTSATTSLLVQNSAGTTSLQVTDDQMVRGYNGTSLRFKLGYTSGGQGISTRDGEFGVGYIDSNNSSALRLLATGTGASYIDGWTEGTSKATNYPLFIGSRANNTGGGTTGATTQENGTQTVFGSAVVDASALVQINSTTRGFLMPRMTTTQINAIASPANGLEVYNTTLNCPCFYNGTSWRQVTNSAM